MIVEEGERWTVDRIRTSHPLERFAAIYRDGGTTMALGNPPIALPLGRAVGGTTVVNSGTCYRPPTAVATAWHQQHGLALADPELLGPRIAEVEATIGVAPAPMEVLGRNGELGAGGSGGAGLAERDRCAATRRAAAAPASARSAAPTTPRAASTSTPCRRPARPERGSSPACT